MDKQLEFYA
jgi:hypothetical protein